MISKSLKWMLRRDSPLYIRPSLDPVFVRFMIGMWRSCTASAQRAGFEANLRLAHGTIEAYEDYRADGLDFELRHDGLLMAFTDRDNLEHHATTLDLVRRFDRDPQVLIGDAVREHEPKLSDAVYGGIFFPQEQHVDPNALMRSLHRRLVELGVRIVEHAPLAGVRIDRRPDHRDHRRGGAPHRRRVRARRRPVDRPAVEADRGAAPGPPGQGLQHRHPSVRAAQRDQPVGRQGRRDPAEPQPAAGRHDGVRRPGRGAQPDPDRRDPGGPGPLLPRLDPADHPGHATGGHPADDARRPADHRAARRR